MLDEPKRVPHKPSSNHPWRKQTPDQIRKWARVESDLLPVHTITTARPETLRQSNKTKRERKGL